LEKWIGSQRGIRLCLLESIKFIVDINLIESPLGVKSKLVHLQAFDSRLLTDVKYLWEVGKHFVLLFALVPGELDLDDPRCHHELPDLDTKLSGKLRETREFGRSNALKNVILAGVCWRGHFGVAIVEDAMVTEELC